MNPDLIIPGLGTNDPIEIIIQLMQKVSSIDRKIHNLVRFGVVTKTYPAKNKVRVSIDGEESGTSFDLPWCPMYAANTRSWEIPQKNEQVIIISPNGNLKFGFVAFRFFRDTFKIVGDDLTQKIQYYTEETLDLEITIIKGENTKYLIDIKNQNGVYEIKNNQSDLKITKDTISIKSTNVKVECTNAEVKAVDTKIESTNISMKGVVAIEGATSIKGAVNIEGATSVKGITNIDGAFTSTGAIIGKTIANEKGPLPESATAKDPISGPLPISQP